jgi:outer membrane protein insertion porin family
VISPGHKTIVAYVNFTRNEALSSAQLLAAIQIQASRFLQKSTYSVPKLDSDIQTLQALYQSKGYLDARIIPLIQPLQDGQRLGITFECNEGPLARTASVRLNGNASMPAEVLARKVSLHSGGPYSPYQAEGDRQNLITGYNDAGFLQAKIQYRATSSEIPDSYEVEFEIEEGVRSFVNKILLFGNYRTQDSVISRQIALKENSPLSLGKMLQSQQALYRLGVFDLVRVAPQSTEGAAAYQDIAVRLEETKPLIVRYGLGYQERERVRATLDLSHVNLWGTAHRADLQLRGSAVEQGAVLSIQQPVPVLQFQNVTSYFTLAGRRRREVSFDQTRANVAYQFSRPISSHSWALLRYNFTNVRLSNVNVSQDQIGREDTPRNLSTFSGTYVNDTRDDYLDPTKGFFTSTNLGLTTKLLGSNDYF